MFILIFPFIVITFSKSNKTLPALPDGTFWDERPPPAETGTLFNGFISASLRTTNNNKPQKSLVAFFFCVNMFLLSNLMFTRALYIYNSL